MPIDFTLDEQQLQLRADARKFADEVLSGVAPAIAGISDAGKCFDATKPFYQQMVDAGFQKLLIPPEYGGSEFSAIAFALATEELARVDVNVPTTLLVTGLGVLPIIRLGTSEQKERWLPRFTDDQPRLAAWAFSEVTGGANYDSADPRFGAQTFALRDGDSWVINGAKQFISNGAGWDNEGPELMCVFCRTDPEAPPHESLALIVVEQGTPGVEIIGAIDTIGHRGASTARIEFHDARVPAENILGNPGDGMDLVQYGFSWTCVPIGAACVGRMRAAFDIAYEFARTDSRSGPHPVIEYQNVGYMLADLKMRIEAARYLTWKTADHFDKTDGKDRELANITKIYCSELTVQAVYDAMRLVGIESYTKRHPLSTIMEDVLVFPIYDCGNMGMRRRWMHEMFRNPTYDPLAAAENRVSYDPLAPAGTLLSTV